VNHKSKEETLSTEDQRACLMVGVLMMVAKMAQQFRAASMFASNPDAAADRLSNDLVLLMRATQKMFPAGDMEAQVIALGRELGFEVEQQYITQGSKIPQ
jgi:hypothetical protein